MIKNQIVSTYDRYTETFLHWGLIILGFSLMLSLAVAETMAALLILGWLVREITRKDLRYCPSLLGIGVLGFILWTMVMIPFSIRPDISLHCLKRTPFMLIFFVAAYRITTPERSQRFLCSLLASGLIASVIAIIKYSLHPGIRVTSTTSGYTTLATFLAIVLPYAVTLEIPNHFMAKIGKWLALFLMMVTIFLTFSRAQWIAAAVVLVLLGLAHYRRPLLLLALVIITLIAFNFEVRQRFFTLANPFQHSTGRIALWQEGLKHLGDRPFTGSGWGTFRVVYHPTPNMLQAGVDPQVGGWHNDYLGVALDQGLIGLAFYILILCTASVRSIRIWLYESRSGYVHNRGLGVGFGCGLVAYAISAMFGGALDPIVSLTIFSLLGALEGRSVQIVAK